MNPKKKLLHMLVLSGIVERETGQIIKPSALLTNKELAHNKKMKESVKNHKAEISQAVRELIEFYGVQRFMWDIEMAKNAYPTFALLGDATIVLTNGMSNALEPYWEDSFDNWYGGETYITNEWYMPQGGTVPLPEVKYYFNSYLGSSEEINVKSLVHFLRTQQEIAGNNVNIHISLCSENSNFDVNGEKILLLKSGEFSYTPNGEGKETLNSPSLLDLFNKARHLNAR